MTGLPERPEVLVEGPNDLWTVDFKGWWRAGSGEHCYPLTVRDAFSRYVLELRLMTKTDTKAVRTVFERLFEFYGVPKVIQSDNGPPFASRGIGGLSKLSVWWVALGIDVVRSRPGTPTDNGGHERMHADVQIDLAADAAASRHLQQHACDVWRDEFNLVRPHEALGMKTPGELYKPTTRRPRRIIVGGHPASATVVHVNKTGTAAVSRTRSVYVGVQPAQHLKVDGLREVHIESPREEAVAAGSTTTSVVVLRHAATISARRRLGARCHRHRLGPRRRKCA